MGRDLTTMSPASRRMVLAAYAAQLPADSPVRQAVWARLKDRTWAPSVEDCPVPWARVQAWFDGLETLRVRQGDAGAREGTLGGGC